MERDIEAVDDTQIEGRKKFLDWYSPGESRTVEIAGVRVTVRFVGRKGRRARIAITTPAGARVARPVNSSEQKASGGQPETR